MSDGIDSGGSNDGPDKGPLTPRSDDEKKQKSELDTSIGVKRNEILRKDRERINNRVLGGGKLRSGPTARKGLNAGIRNGKLLQFPTTYCPSEGPGNDQYTDILPDPLD